MGGARAKWLGVAGALAFAALGCAPTDAPPGNVVVVLVDQLRKDAADTHLHAVNRLAGDGVVFEDMRSVAPWTYPSVVSLLSGLYPQQHGADGHVEKNELSYFDAGVPLLQKRLREEGWSTAAFVANPFLLEWNLFHAGFEHFDGSFIRGQGNRRGDDRVWRPERMFAHRVNAAVRLHFDAQPRTRREFTYVHYIDVHGPWRGAPFPADYAAAVGFVDEMTAELHAYFSDRYGGDLLFVVTSDHGRAQDDDLTVGAGRSWRRDKETVHDFNLRVPFAILPGDAVPAGRVVEGPCSLVDFVPTILDWLGLAPRSPRPGTSLLPAIRGRGALPSERPIYARHSAFGYANDGVVIGRRKYVRHFDIETGKVRARRVYDLEADPRETRSLRDDFGDAREIVQREAGDHGLAFRATFAGVSPDVEAPLRALGYLEEGEDPTSDESSSARLD